MNDSAFEKRTLANIAQYGCSVIHIAAEDALPPFAYSVGITKTSNAPELVVIGLKQEIAHFIINEYNRRIRAGERFPADKQYGGFIDHFDVLAKAVDQSYYEEYFGYGLWFYEGPNFQVLQFVYPTTAGVWPWEPKASDWFRSNQPLLFS